MKKVMCNWTPHCENMYCCHRLPHLPVPLTELSEGFIYCNQEDADCPSELHDVKCVPVKFGIIRNTMPQLFEHVCKRLSDD